MAHRTDADGYCAMSDLPADQCASPSCRPDLVLIEGELTVANEALLPSQITRRTGARHVSIVSCGHHAHPGMTIALGPDGWVCDECDPGGSGSAAAG
jgi:hypothetical protein